MSARQSAVLADAILYSSMQGVSLTGAWLHRTAMGWMVWELTHSVAWVGAMSLASLVASMAVAPFAGVFADRRNPYRALLGAQSLQVGCAASLALVSAGGWLSIEWLWCMAVVLAVIDVFNQPVRMGIVNLLAPADALSQAIAVNASINSMARFVGPMLAGVILLHGQPWQAFALNALSFLPVMLVAVRLKHRLDVPVTHPAGSVAGELGDGLTYVWRSRQIRTLFLLSLSVGVLLRALPELLPAINGALRGGPGTLASMISAQGVGAFAGSALMLRRLAGKTHRRLILIGGLGLATTYAVFSQSTGWPWLVFLFGLGGLFQTLLNIAMQSSVQSAVCATYRGRSLALYGMSLRAGTTLGAFTISVIAGLFPLADVLCASAVLSVMITLGICLRPRAVDPP